MVQGSVRFNAENNSSYGKDVYAIYFVINLYMNYGISLRRGRGDKGKVHVKSDTLASSTNLKTNKN